jgi:hypothetical protein
MFFRFGELENFGGRFRSPTQAVTGGEQQAGFALAARSRR